MKIAYRIAGMAFYAVAFFLAGFYTPKVIDPISHGWIIAGAIIATVVGVVANLVGVFNEDE